jgi:hypothetical protein
MLLRIAQTLQHVFRPTPSITSSISGLFAFSSCRPIRLARSGLADEVPTPRLSQTPQDLDEAKVKDEQRRARKAAYQRKYIQKKKMEDPVWAEQYRLRESERRRRWVQEQKEDETSRIRYLDTQINYNEERFQRRKKDPVWSERFQASERERWRRHAASYYVRRSQSIKKWFQLNKDCFDTFAWERWTPIYLTESIDKTCAACGVRNRRGPRRLWFIRKSDPELWDCLSCFLSSDVSDIVPVEGAERFYKGQYLHPQTAVTECADHTGTQEAVDRKDENDDSKSVEEKISSRPRKRGDRENNET